MEVVAQAGDAEDLLRKVNAHKPDVAIVDVRMPPTQTDEGLRAAASIREQFPGVGVLVLSQYVEEAYALDLFADGAEGLGYLLKDRVADIDRFVDSVRRVGEGGSALDPEVVGRLLGRRRRSDPLEALSPRRARGARADGRGPLEPRDRRGADRQRARRREARDEHLLQARPRARATRPTAASSPSSPTSARRSAYAPIARLRGARVPRSAWRRSRTNHARAHPCGPRRRAPRRRATSACRGCSSSGRS